MVIFDAFDIEYYSTWSYFSKIIRSFRHFISVGHTSEYFHRRNLQYGKTLSFLGDGNFDASINTWSDKTYSTIHQSKVTRLGSPIYFSVESAYAINGVYYSINSCKFGTDTVDFEFLRQSGCRYGPLHVKAHDTFLTATGERQRFQYNAFVFRGHPYSGMKLTCEIEMCLQLSDTNTCPTQATGVCEENFDNGTA